MGQVHEEGIDYIFDLAFATPGDYYVGLCGDSVIAKDAVYTDLIEVTGSGYALIALSTITVSTYLTDDRIATGNEVTFSATGNWTEAVHYFIVTPDVGSGTYILISSNALDTAVTLTSGESVAVTPKITGTA